MPSPKIYQVANLQSSLTVGGNQANSAYGQANLAYTQANNSYGQANLAYTQANSAFTAANNSNLKLGGVISGTLNVTQDIIVGGNIYLEGNTTYINVATYSVEDPLIYLASNNSLTDSVDIGFMGGKNTSGTYSHTGLARDATDGKWKLFDGLADEGHVGNVIDFANTRLATIVANVEANTLSVVNGVSGNVNFDSGTLFIDSVGNNIGVGTTNPRAKFDVQSGKILAAISGTPTGTYNGAFNAHADTGGSTGLQITVGSAYSYFNADGSDIILGSDQGSTGKKVTVSRSSPDYSLVINSSGSTGVGVIPSAWGSKYRAMQLGDSRSTSVIGRTDTASWGAFGVNVFFDSADANKYITSDFASLYLQYNGQHIFYTAASGTAGNTISFTHGMTLNGSGNLGVGETSPPAPGGADARVLILKASKFPQFIYKATSAAANSTTWRTISRDTLEFQIQTVNDAIDAEQTAYEIVRNTGANTINYHRWLTGSSERVRITSGGDFGIGTASPGAKLDVSAAGTVTARINNTSSNTDAYLICKNTAGESYFGVNATGPYIYTATAQALVFHTNNAERARIDSSGRLLIAGTTASYAYGFLQVNDGKVIIRSSDSNYTQLQIGNANSGGEAAIAFISGATAFGTDPTSTNGDTYIWAVGANVYGIGGNYFGIGNKSVGNYVAKITYNSTSWTFASDERLKDVSGEITNAVDKVSNLRAVYYSWKNDEKKVKKVGLIAQDVLKVLPEAVDQPEEFTKDGKPNYLGLAHNDIIPLLVAAIKELNAKVAALESK